MPHQIETIIVGNDDTLYSVWDERIQKQVFKTGAMLKLLEAKTIKVPIFDSATWTGRNPKPNYEMVVWNAVVDIGESCNNS